MPNYHVVTDSGAHFPTPHPLLTPDRLTIVPNRIMMAGRTYTEGVDLDAESAVQLLAGQATAPTIVAPSEADYVEVYRRLAEHCDAIISVHASREIFPSYQHALAASHQFSGRCPVVVIDSGNLCAAQGMLVKVALGAAQTLNDLDGIVRIVRSAVDRVYSMYAVEQVAFLQQNQVMSSSHAALCAMLGLRPFLSMENGRMIVVEKARSRGQVVDRLVEFISEFTDLEDAVILQPRNHAAELTRMIRERLNSEFAEQDFQFAVYGPTMATLIGTEAVGVVVLERADALESEAEDDDS